MPPGSFVSADGWHQPERQVRPQCNQVSALPASAVRCSATRHHEAVGEAALEDEGAVEDTVDDVAGEWHRGQLECCHLARGNQVS